MIYNNDCMNKLILAIFNGLVFSDDNYDNNNLRCKFTLEQVIEDNEEFNNYSPTEIKSCFHILVKRNLIETENNKGYSPRMIIDFTSEGYKELVSIIQSNNLTKN